MKNREIISVMTHNPDRFPINTLLIWIGIFLTSLVTLHLSLNVMFDADEMETLYASWAIAQGQVPYRDFWQMHTPLAYYLFAPLFFIYKTTEVFWAARLVVYFLLLINGYFLFILANRFFSRQTAALSVLSYLVCLPVLSKMIEIRPDVLVVFFSNLSLIFLVVEGRMSPSRSFFWAGIWGALAVLSKQSGLIFIVGLVIFFIIRALAGGKEFWEGAFPKNRFNGRTYLSFLAGLLVPGVIFYFDLICTGALSPFIKHSVANDFLNAALLLTTESQRLLPTNFLNPMFFNNLPLLVSAAALFLDLGFKGPMTSRIRPACVLFFVLLLVSLLSVHFILQVWQQELLLFAQYLALAAAPGLTILFDHISCSYPKKSQQVAFIALFIILFCLPPLAHTYSHKGFRSELQLGRMNNIIAATNPQDKVLSIQEACLFRPNVYTYRMASPRWESPLVIARNEESFMDEILNGKIIAIVPERFFPSHMPRLSELINDNYVLLPSGFYIPGQVIKLTTDGIIGFNALVEGRYMILKDWKGGIIVDGVPFESKDVYLTRGQHAISLPSSSWGCLLVYDLSANKKTGNNNN